MTDEEKKAKETGDANEAAGKNRDGSEKVAPIIPTDQKPDPKVEALEKENRELKFGNELTNIAATYPHAADFKDDIKKKVDAGMSVSDATIVVLNENKKLITAEQIKRGKQSSGFGGSMDTTVIGDKKDPTPGEAGSAEFYANRFKELEQDGQIRLS